MLCFDQAVSVFQLSVWVGQGRVHEGCFQVYTHAGFLCV